MLPLPSEIMFVFFRRSKGGGGRVEGDGIGGTGWKGGSNRGGGAGASRGGGRGGGFGGLKKGEPSDGKRDVKRGFAQARGGPQVHSYSSMHRHTLDI